MLESKKEPAIFDRIFLMKKIREIISGMRKNKNKENLLLKWLKDIFKIITSISLKSYFMGMNPVPNMAHKWGTNLAHVSQHDTFEMSTKIYCLQ